MLIAQRTIIINVCSYFEKEGHKSKYSGRPRPIGNTADASGYCERTVSREKRAKDESFFVSPAKRYKKERKKIIVDDFATVL